MECFSSLKDFQLYLHIGPCVQTVIEEKPCGICVIRLPSNPHVEVSNTSIQLLCNGLVLD